MVIVVGLSSVEALVTVIVCTEPPVNDLGNIETATVAGAILWGDFVTGTGIIVILVGVFAGDIGNLEMGILVGVPGSRSCLLGDTIPCWDMVIVLVGVCDPCPCICGTVIPGAIDVNVIVWPWICPICTGIACGWLVFGFFVIMTLVTIGAEVELGRICLLCATFTVPSVSWLPLENDGSGLILIISEIGVASDPTGSTTTFGVEWATTVPKEALVVMFWVGFPTVTGTELSKFFSSLCKLSKAFKSLGKRDAKSTDDVTSSALLLMLTSSAEPEEISCGHWKNITSAFSSFMPERENMK